MTLSSLMKTINLSNDIKLPGKDEGLPIIVLGGQHGDVPLEPSAGGLIADLLVDTGQSLAMDMSDFPTKAAQTRFVTEFCERLYRRKAPHRTTLHLIIDEADEFAPQKPMKEETRMLHNMEILVRRGRSRGVGVTLITQRSATLNKNVLNLIDTLIAMRILGPNDRKVVESWMTAKALQDESGIMDSIPSLPTGTAWIWSPVRGILQQVKIRQIRTFDSYATPKPGQVRAEPKKLAPIDLTKLGEQIQATAERAKENDPRELRAKVRELERKLVEKKAAVVPAVKVEIKEVPVITDKQIDLLQSLHADINNLIGNCAELLSRIHLEIKSVAQKTSGINPITPSVKKPVNYSGNIPKNIPVNGSITGGLRRRLIALAQRPQGLTKKQLGVRAGLSSASGTFSTYLGKLRTYGLVDGSGLITITEAGRQNVGNLESLPGGLDLLNYWLGELGNSGAARMLQAAYDAYPKELTKAELAEAASLSADSGTFSTYIGKLRTLELINGLKASHELFE